MKYIKDAIHFHMDSDTAVTVGKFDGIHRGHEYLAKKVVQHAASHALQSVVITFDKSPRTYFSGNGSSAEKNLITNQERAYILEKLGVNYLLELSFTEELIHMSPEEFLRLLTGQFRMKYMVCGTDFTFGSKGAGDVEMLESSREKKGFLLDVVNKIKEQNKDISSSYIRQEILKANLENANRLLGYEYFLYGSVVHGNHIGTSLSMPTINIIPTSDKLLPPNGVYATVAETDGLCLPSVSNIGIRPTIEEETKRICVETHILDYSKDLYDKVAKISFLKYLRPERRFSSLEELSAQMQKDVDETNRFFSGERNITKLLQKY
ncbi:MAG: bifunctional riboflavin kinase/FAD synthetase [Lachnospiraceae bacterium]|nr:bifunctional riboflavin kinase/FAD synthetase [Lachnospiraceae bacterium]